MPVMRTAHRAYMRQLLCHVLPGRSAGQFAGCVPWQMNLEMARSDPPQLALQGEAGTRPRHILSGNGDAPCLDSSLSPSCLAAPAEERWGTRCGWFSAQAPASRSHGGGLCAAVHESAEVASAWKSVRETVDERALAYAHEAVQAGAAAAKPSARPLLVRRRAVQPKAPATSGNFSSPAQADGA
ncbi:unnamed protein product [Symbiodinium sp. CCMP2456]|nr:unnamed protein product [Symbiodinium sp. CCMP2456]